jgi:hypothetical protein
VTEVNQAQRDTWNGDSGLRWVADADRRDAVLAPVAESLLAAARIAPGESVLDLGCGCGATTISAARQADPDLVRSTLTRAGWTAVDSRAVTVSLRLGDGPADATAYLADSGVGRAVLDTIPAGGKPAALDAVADALAPHATTHGVHLAAAIWISTGTAS